MATGTDQQTGSFPEADELQAFVTRRHRLGRMWRGLFVAAALAGIIALSALVLTTLNNTVGYVALQNVVDPATLAAGYYKQQVLSAPNTTASEDDEDLAAGIAGSPYAVGFFGYAYYKEHLDTLKLTSVDGITPTAASVESGEYGLSRPLLLYTTQQLMQDRPQVAAFVAYYLAHVNEEIDDVGYFAASQDVLSQGFDSWQRATGLTATTADNLGPLTGSIVTAGSSTVAPLTQRMASRFQDAGFTGPVAIDGTGTDAGIRRFCVDRDVDIVNASRRLLNDDLIVCRKDKREPVDFQVGSDGIAVVVSRQNGFLTDLSETQLRQVFTTAQTWSDVNPDWPDQPILRYVPGADSGTLDFFFSHVFPSDLTGVPKEGLVGILQERVSKGRFRALESQGSLAERSAGDVYDLVLSEVVKPQIVGTWTLVESVLSREEVIAEAAQIPNARLDFRSWVSGDFLTSPQSSKPELAGVRTAILGSILVTLIAAVVFVPIGIGAAIYLEEYGTGSRFDQLVETNINNLAGVPSIIYGMLGLAIFVRAFQPLTSGTLLGLADPTTANGRTIVSAGLTLGLLILPLIIINAREAIRAVPNSLREASLGLGATKWQTIWSHVLPNAIPGILTGVILSVSRALGETAPLVVVGAATFIVVDPDGPFSKFTTLPIQIYQWTSRPQQEFQHLAAAAIMTLLVLLLALNAGAIIIRNRFSRRL